MKKIFSVTFFVEGDNLKTRVEFHRPDGEGSILHGHEILGISDAFGTIMLKLNQQSLNKDTMEDLK